MNESMGTGEHDQIFQGNLRTKWILGGNLEFFFKGTEHIFGNKGDFGNFSREHGNTDPLGGLSNKKVNATTFR